MNPEPVPLLASWSRDKAKLRPPVGQREGATVSSVATSVATSPPVPPGTPDAIERAGGPVAIKAETRATSGAWPRNELEDELSKPPTEQEIRLEKIAVAIGIDGTKSKLHMIVRRGDNFEMTFWVIENGKYVPKVAILTADELLTQRKAEARILTATGIVPKDSTRSMWRTTAELIAAEAALNVEDADSEEDETRSWIFGRGRYLDLRDDFLKHPPGDQQLRESFYTAPGKTRIGIREGGALLVHSPSFLRALRGDGEPSLTLRKLTNRLGRLGFKDAHASIEVKSKSKRPKVRVWKIDLKTLFRGLPEDYAEIMGDHDRTGR